VRGHVSLHGGARGSDDLRSLQARDPAVQQPDRQHLVPDQAAGMVGSFLMNDPLLVLGESDTAPSHRGPPCDAPQKQDLLAGSKTGIPESPDSRNASFSSPRGISHDGPAHAAPRRLIGPPARSTATSLRPRADAPSRAGGAPPNERAGPLLRRCPRP